jgi:hypothetical protein
MLHNPRCKVFFILIAERDAYVIFITFINKICDLKQYGQGLKPVKIRTVKFYQAAFVVIWVLGLILARESLTKNLSDLFIAAIGLLTFVSIYYGVMISGGGKLIRDITHMLKKEQGKKIEETLTKIASQARINKNKELNKLVNEVEDIDAIIQSFNLNKLLFIAVIGYLFSILFYLLPESRVMVLGDTFSLAVAGQVISFWTAFITTIAIVTSWFTIQYFKK